MLKSAEPPVAYMMNTRSDITTTSEITAEACSWIAQIDSGALTASDMAALREWMSRSPAHAAEIRAIAQMSGQLSVLADLAPALEKSAGAHNPARKTTPRARLAPVFSAAFAFMLISGVVLSILLTGDDGTPIIYKTAVGEYRTLALEDGTQVSLNTDSQIEVDFNDAERRVRLIDGEALFDVVSNPKRPFVVYSDTAVAEAVGTSFVVRLREAVTELAVVEGVVAFSKLPQSIDLPATERLPSSTRKDASAPPPTAAATAEPAAERVLVKAGQALTSIELTDLAATAQPSAIPVLSERDLQRKLSWTDGFLEFSDTPLEEVIAELTRHNDVSIEIVDADLRQLQFGGIFRTGDVEQLLGALEGLGVDVEQQDPTHYRLRMADAK